MNDGEQSGGPRFKNPKKRIEPLNDPKEPAFIPPEEMAAMDVSDEPSHSHKEPAKPNWKNSNVKEPSKFSFLDPRNWSKKQAIIAGVVGAFLIIGGASAFVLTRDKPEPPKPKPVAKKVEAPKPTTVASQLTGIQGPLDQNDQPVIGVMIENSPDARPQSGLNQAGVVFEAIAEGGITRFLALYQQDKPDYLGPVRSARIYYAQWLQGFDAPYVHAGGPGDVINHIRSSGMKEIAHGANGGLFNRTRTRYAPHNLYSDVNKLSEHAKSKGWTKSEFLGFVRKAKEEPSKAPTARSINMVISGALYNVHYDYNPTTNSYNRVLAGKPHVDERSQAQLSPKVAIAMVVPYNIAADGLHSDYKAIGSGKAYIFQDGIVVEGIWEKTSEKSQIKFGDANGAPLGINPGQTWITAVGAASNVNFTP